MICLRTASEIKKIKIASHISALALQLAGSFCRPGVSSYILDEKVRRFIFNMKAKPNFLNYNGYPKSCCVSVNEVVIHGIPSKDIVFKDGDIVSVDVGAEYEGYNGDNAYTFIVGSVSEKIKKFLSTTKEALYRGIAKALPGNRIGDISQAIEDCIKRDGYGIVREFVGHGVGERLHEEPEIPNYLKDSKKKGARLYPGMVLAIEPMTIESGEEIVKEVDGWTIKTKNHSLAAHFEHTILVTEGKPIILTKLAGEYDGVKVWNDC